MKKNVFVLAAIFAAVSLIAINIADAQWRSETHDVYNAPTGIDVIIDGNLDEWDGVLDSVTGTDGSQFCGVEFEGRESVVKVWEDLGGTWSGPEDHTTCFMIAWDADAIYIALSVTDDEHEHAAGGAWNGDGIQLGFEPTGKRTAGLQLFLYNVALRDNGDIILNNERTNGKPGLSADTDLAITRDDDTKVTTYEIRFTAENLGFEGSLSEGDEIGVGICVNDGDKDALGQKGWSGWNPHVIVHGKNSEKTGLLVLTNNAVTAVEPANKLTTTWGTIKSVR